MIGDTISMWKLGKQNFTSAVLWAGAVLIGEMIVNKLLSALNISFPFSGLVIYAIVGYFAAQFILKKKYEPIEYLKVIGVSFLINLIVGLVLVGIVGIGILALIVGSHGVMV